MDRVSDRERGGCEHTPDNSARAMLSAHSTHAVIAETLPHALHRKEMEMISVVPRLFPRPGLPWSRSWLQICRSSHDRRCPAREGRVVDLAAGIDRQLC